MTAGTRTGFTLLEMAISLALVSVLLAVLLPALATARTVSDREECASKLLRCSHAWHLYLEDHGGEFPFVPVQPGWQYAGVRFSALDNEPFLDTLRPLTNYLPIAADGTPREQLLSCPGDRGITGATEGVGTGDRTAFRSFGTSYRANAALLDARDDDGTSLHRGVRRDDIATSASRLVVMGDPIWFEVLHGTGRDAAWHGEATKGNLLFLDGAVRFREIYPLPRVGPAVYEPMRHQRSRAD